MLDISALQSPGIDIGALQSIFIPPAIAVSPSSGPQNQALALTVTGTSTHFVSGTTTVAFSGTGIAVGTITVASATSLTAAITIAPSAALGARTLTVTTGAEAPTTSFAITLPTQRGNIDYDQIRSSVRQGAGVKFQMFAGSTAAAGNVLVYDAAGNASDGGTLPGSGIQLAQDLAGTAALPKVVGLQARPVAATAPTDGQLLTWVAANSDWEPKGIPTSNLSVKGVLVGLVNVSPVLVNGHAIS